MSDRDLNVKPASGFIPRFIAFSVWGALILVCVGFAVNQGLFCADDGWFAVVAKSLSKGLGYSTTFTDNEGRLEPIRFDPWTGTGPGLIIPCAMALKITGINEVVPGVSAIIVWGGVFSLLIYMISREVGDYSLPLGVGLFCLAIISLFSKQFHLWTACMGEIPAVAYLATGHWLLAMGRSPRRSIFLAGLFLGLAFQTKVLAVLACTGALFIFAARLHGEKCDRKDYFHRGAIFFLGCMIPTFLFEVWKIGVLGLHGWVHNWRQFFWALRSLTVERPPEQTLGLLQERIALIGSDHSIHVLALLGVVAVAFYLFRVRSSNPWSCLFAGLTISVSFSAAYWLLFSIGWIRYLGMAVGLGCFALTVPVYGLPETWKKGLFASLVLIFLSGGIATFSSKVTHVENGLFKPSNLRLARKNVVANIRDLKKHGPVILAARFWPELAEVEFNLDDSLNFYKLKGGLGRPMVIGMAGKKVVLINQRWGASYMAGRPEDEHADIEALIGEKITSVLFSEGPFELLETSGPMTKVDLE